MHVQGIKEHWNNAEVNYSPRFRAEIYRIVPTTSQNLILNRKCKNRLWPKAAAGLLNW